MEFLLLQGSSSSFFVMVKSVNKATIAMAVQGVGGDTSARIAIMASSFTIIPP